MLLESLQIFRNIQIRNSLILFLILLCKVYQTKSGLSLALSFKQAPIVITHKLNEQISTDTTSIQLTTILCVAIPDPSWQVVSPILGKNFIQKNRFERHSDLGSLFFHPRCKISLLSLLRLSSGALFRR